MRLIDADAFSEQYGSYYAEQVPENGFIGTVGELIAKQHTIKPEVRHVWWIECDYTINYEDYIYCSNCRAGFAVRHMTFKQYCPKCGTKMDGGTENATL